MSGKQLEEAFCTLEGLEWLADYAAVENDRQSYENAARWYRICLNELGLRDKYFNWVDNYHSRISHGIDD